MIREKEIEKTLISQVRKADGMCLKFISPGWSGAPDRLCLLPGGRLFFAELKRPGGKIRPLQERRRKQLEELGFEVVLIDSKDGAAQTVGSPTSRDDQTDGGGAGAKT